MREALHNWLYDQVKRVSGASDLAKAMLGDPALAGLGGVPLRWPGRNGHQRAHLAAPSQITIRRCTVEGTGA
jgi:hypothetical protein